jgi:hypothetical protein
MQEAPIVSTGNKKIDNGLMRIEKKIDRKETFGSADDRLVNFLLRRKLACQQCRFTLSRLYLHLKYGRTGALNSVEWSIMGKLRNHKKVLEIPEMQAIPIDDH